MSAAFICVLLCLCAVGAGFLTASIGFGGAIFMLLFLPRFMPFLQSVGVSSIVVYSGIAFLAIVNRKHIRWKLLWLPAAVYIVFSVPAAFALNLLELSVLKAAFALFIILIGLYNMYCIYKGEGIRLKNNLPTTVVCASLSGIGAGLFGIGGPPIALYFLAVTEGDKKAYIATVQAFFIVSMIPIIIARFLNRTITFGILPIAIPGMLASLLGIWLGTVTLSRVNAKLLKLCVCVFMVLTGIVNIAECVM